MKSLLIFILLLCFLNIFAQNKWQKLNGPQGGYPRSLKAFGDTMLAGVGDKGKLYYSFDRGDNWYSSFKLNDIISDFIIADDNSIIFNAGKLGIFKTYDLKTYSSLYHNGYFFICLIKDKTGVIYAGTDNGNIYSSSNNGTNWILSLNNNSGYSLNNFAQLSDSTILAGTRDYVYSKKNGSFWNGLYFNNFGDIIVSTDVYDNIYICPGGGHMKLSADRGNTWLDRDINGFLFGNIMYNFIYANRLIGAYGDQSELFGTGWGMALSDDQGLTWRWNNTGLPPKFAAAFSLSKSGNDTYVGTNAAGVYKSTNFGDSWFSINNGINAANTFAVNFDNEGNLWAACYSNGLYKSTDKGLTWNLKNNGFTNSYLYNFISDDKGILFATTEQGTYSSTDKGENWNQISELFFYYLHKDNLNRIYGLSYGNGLYRTTDQGNNWIRIDNGFINGYVFGFAIDSSNNIYTGTFGGAIY